MEPNEIRCPLCNDGTISIEVATFACYYSDEDVETYGDIEFDGTNRAFCRACSWEGRVFDLRVSDVSADDT